MVGVVLGAIRNLMLAIQGILPTDIVQMCSTQDKSGKLQFDNFHHDALKIASGGSRSACLVFFP